jgi:thioredoxin reductase (NADPH)
MRATPQMAVFQQSTNATIPKNGGKVNPLDSPLLNSSLGKHIDKREEGIYYVLIGADPQHRRKERQMKDGKTKTYEVIIIGGGPAGMTAGLYASRSRFHTLLIERGLFGGQMTTTDLIENYPGFPEGITGEELSRLMEEQAKRFGLEVVSDEVTEIKLEGDVKFVRTYEMTYCCEALILCMGTEYRKLGAPGELEFAGKGVSYCSTCDGAFFQDRDIVVVGGGDSALTEALYLTKFAKQVTVIHRRDQFRGTKIYQERANSNPKIKFLLNSVVEEIKGNTVVNSVVVKNVKTGEKSELGADGAFIFVGITPRTHFLKGLIDMDDAGYILTGGNCETSVKGVFAAGDCRKQLLRQISTAVGDGATAAFAVEKYLESRE